MDPLNVIVVGCLVLLVGLFPLHLRNAARSRRRVAELAETIEKELGAQVFSGFEFRSAPTRAGGGSVTVKDRFVARARGLLPTWMDAPALSLRPLEGSEVGGRPSLLLRVVFGEALAPALAEKKLGFVALDAGDLVVAGRKWRELDFDVEERTTAALVALARACKERANADAFPAALADITTDVAALLSERAEALELLMAHYPHHAVTTEAKQSAQRSGVALLEVLAASVDDSGRVILEKHALNEHLPSAARERAINRLVPTAEPTLLIRLSSAPPSGTKIALARALAQLPPSSETSGALVGLIDGNRFVDEAVADALGSVGDPAALEPLVAALEKVPRGSTAAEQFEAAIVRIRRRHGLDEQRGGLTLSAEEVGGELSVSRAGGELSQVEDQDPSE